jgi:hypothetical protein
VLTELKNVLKEVRELVRCGKEVFLILKQRNHESKIYRGGTVTGSKH